MTKRHTGYATFPGFSVCCRHSPLLLHSSGRRLDAEDDEDPRHRADEAARHHRGRLRLTAHLADQRRQEHVQHLGTARSAGMLVTAADPGGSPLADMLIVGLIYWATAAAAVRHTRTTKLPVTAA